MPSNSLWSGQPHLQSSHLLDLESNDPIAGQLGQLRPWWSGGDDCVLFVCEKSIFESRISSRESDRSGKDQPYLTESSSDLGRNKLHDVSATTNSGIVLLIDLTHSDHTDLESDLESLGSIDIVREVNTSVEVVNETDSENVEKQPTLLPGLDSLHLRRCSHRPGDNRLTVHSVGGTAGTGNHTPLIPPHLTNEPIVISSSDEAQPRAAVPFHPPKGSEECHGEHERLTPKEDPLERRREWREVSMATPGALESKASLDSNLTPWPAVQEKKVGLSSVSSKILQEKGVGLSSSLEEGVWLDPAPGPCLEGKRVGLGVEALKHSRIDEGIEVGSVSSDGEDVMVVGVEGEEVGGVRDEMITSVLAGELATSIAPLPRCINGTVPGKNHYSVRILIDSFADYHLLFCVCSEDGVKFYHRAALGPTAVIWQVLTPSPLQSQRSRLLLARLSKCR